VRLCNRGRHDKVLKSLGTLKSYRQFNLVINCNKDDYPFIFYLIAENQIGMLRGLTEKSYCEDIVADFQNPVTASIQQNITPIVFAMVNEQEEAVEVLKAKGASLFTPGY
jgi:hypothetical protein